MQHQQERRILNQTLVSAIGVNESDQYDSIEGSVKAKTRLKRLNGFKKYSDEPLGKVIKQKLERRARYSK